MDKRLLRHRAFQKYRKSHRNRVGEEGVCWSCGRNVKKSYS